MSQTLRPYQTEAVHAVFDAIDDGHKRILYTMATGCGKTTTFAELVRIFREYNNSKVLVLAHRRELITQAWQRIRDHCCLDEWEIGIELAETTASPSASVVVGSVQTVKGAHRLPNWKPDIIITDEAHRAVAVSYQRIYERFGVKSGDCILIGCTATAKRTDKQSLYAIKPDGTAVALIDKKTKKQYEADPSDSVFERHCYDFSVLDAIESGWLVPMCGYAVRSNTDLSDVETDTDGDFKDGQLQKAVDNAQRTLLAINAWEEIARTRPTIVFCAGVEHAHHAAELWRQAGYTAAALDGTTDNTTRFRTLEGFRSGEIQVLCNMGLFTEGTDIPACACVVHLRPTKSWNLYVQMTGRGSRTLPGVVDGLDEPEARKEAISASVKPDCLVIDVVDICESNDLCSVPSILDLPANLDLEGASVTQAKRLLEEFDEVKEQVIGECPTTFHELEFRLEQVSLLRESKARTVNGWRATERGFRFVNIPIGYQVELLPVADNQYHLLVRHATKGIIHQQTGKPCGRLNKYLDGAAEKATDKIDEHRATMSRGTLERLTAKQINCLSANKHSRLEIDCMPYRKAKALIAQYMAAWKSRQQPHDDTAA